MACSETKFGQVAALTKQILAQASGKTTGPQEVDGRLPALVFWHGGGLVAANKESWLPGWLWKDALDAGFAIISPNYSLLTPCTAHDIVAGSSAPASRLPLLRSLTILPLADIKDCFSWIKHSLNAHLMQLTSQQIDPDRLAVTGASAGGCMTYLSLVHADPKPRAALSIFGMGGDFLSDHYVKPHTEPFVGVMPFKGHPREYMPLLSGDAYKALEQSTSRVVETEIDEAHSAVSGG